MRRKRKRSIKWGPVLFALLIANIGAGLWLSPITSTTSVRVAGGAAEDRTAIGRILNGLQDRPYLQVGGRDIESRLQRIPRVQRAELSTNIFGRAVVTLTYHRPVARLKDKPQIKLSSAGELYFDDRPMEELPDLQVPVSAQEPNLTLGSTTELKILAEIAQRAVAANLEEKVSVEADSNGILCLNMDGGGKVVFGSSDNLDAKFLRLKEYLEENPGGLKGHELNLTSPEHPTVKP